MVFLLFTVEIWTSFQRAPRIRQSLGVVSVACGAQVIFFLLGDGSRNMACILGSVMEAPEEGHVRAVGNWTLDHYWWTSDPEVDSLTFSWFLQSLVSGSHWFGVLSPAVYKKSLFF